MSAFYTMQYEGIPGNIGVGALYVGKGVVVGADVAGGRYHGSYSESGGRLKGTVTLSMVADGMLVTGQAVPAGTKIPLTIDWPSNFADGKPHAVSVQGKPVYVLFQKVGDIP